MILHQLALALGTVRHRADTYAEDGHRYGEQQRSGKKDAGDDVVLVEEFPDLPDHRRACVSTAGGEGEDQKERTRIVQ